MYVIWLKEEDCHMELKLTEGDWQMGAINAEIWAGEKEAA